MRAEGTRWSRQWYQVEHVSFFWSNSPLCLLVVERSWVVSRENKVRTRWHPPTRCEMILTGSFVIQVSYDFIFLSACLFFSLSVTIKCVWLVRKDEAGRPYGPKEPTQPGWGNGGAKQRSNEKRNRMKRGNRKERNGTKDGKRKERKEYGQTETWMRTCKFKKKEE